MVHAGHALGQGLERLVLALDLALARTLGSFIAVVRCRISAQGLTATGSRVLVLGVFPVLRLD
jgi:hypothetical protein